MAPALPSTSKPSDSEAGWVVLAIALLLNLGCLAIVTVKLLRRRRRRRLDDELMRLMSGRGTVRLNSQSPPKTIIPLSRPPSPYPFEMEPTPELEPPSTPQRAVSTVSKQLAARRGHDFRPLRLDACGEDAGSNARWWDRAVLTKWDGRGTPVVRSGLDAGYVRSRFTERFEDECDGSHQGGSVTEIWEEIDLNDSKRCSMRPDAKVEKWLSGMDEAESGKDVFEEIELEDSVRRSMRPDQKVWKWMSGLTELAAHGN